MLTGTGCEQGTEPTAPPPPSGDPFTYVPAALRLTVPCGGYADLEVRGEETGTVVWRTSSGQTGRGIRFRTFAERWLPDTVHVVVDTAGIAVEHHWIVDPMATLAIENFTPRQHDIVGVWRFPQTFTFHSSCEIPDITWSVDGEKSGTGTDFSFIPDRAGGYDVTASLLLAGTTFTRDWHLDIMEPGENLLYSPVATALEIFETRSQYFSVAADSPLPEVTWRVDGALGRTGATFAFAGEVPGLHVITVATTLPDTIIEHTWHLTVLEVAAGRPPPVTDVTALVGPQLGQTTLHWSPVADAAFAVVSYEARISLDGPVTADNWPIALHLGTGTWPAGAARYDLTVWNEAMDWASGQEVCLAVRARDVHGTLSDLTTNACVVVDNDWWIRGHVVGPDGQPAAAVRVLDLSGGPTAFTDAAGDFEAGPFRPRHTAELMFDGPVAGDEGLYWIPWQADPMTAVTITDLDVLLLPEYGADPTCHLFRESFCQYLRVMTVTVNPLVNRPNVNLYKWDSYPVDVHVPDFVGPDGIDYGAACRGAVDIWNTSMGAEYLHLVDAPPNPGIAFNYDLDIPNVMGRARLVQPGDGELHMAETVPQEVAVDLYTGFSTVQRLMETALHELGHCLGLHNHAFCNDTPYLMNYSSGGALDQGADQAIHQDERTAVRIIRQLPQGLDMSHYPLL